MTKVNLLIAFGRMSAPTTSPVSPVLTRLQLEQGARSSVTKAKVTRYESLSADRKPGLNQQQDEITQAIIALIDRTETLSKQILALINLNALLVREVCLTQNKPLEHFAKLEAEVGGLGEAIAMGTRQFTDVAVSSRSITELFEQVLRQGRALVEDVEVNPRAEG